MIWCITVGKRVLSYTWICEASLGISRANETEMNRTSPPAAPHLACTAQTLLCPQEKHKHCAVTNWEPWHSISSSCHCRSPEVKWSDGEQTCIKPCCLNSLMLQYSEGNHLKNRNIKIRSNYSVCRWLEKITRPEGSVIVLIYKRSPKQLSWSQR